MVVEQDKVVEQEPIIMLFITDKGIIPEPNRPPLLQSGKRHRRFKDFKFTTVFVGKVPHHN